ncbi:MAG: TIGR02710 family CRISPR-associated CARF protein [Ignavibacteriaceae bacterium]
MDEEKQSKRLIFITLGKGPGVSHGLLFSIKKQNPDTIVLMTTKESNKTYEELTNNLRDKKIDIIKEDCDEINDIEVIYKNFSNIIQTYLNKGYSKENIVVDYTSGTKVMSAALVAVAIAKGLGNFSYVFGQRDISGRVQSGTERLSSLTVNRIITENYLNLFITFFNKNQFDLALNILNQITEVHPDFDEKIKLYKSLALAFSYWEKFNFKKSFDLLDNIDQSELAKNGLKKKVEAAKQYLYKLKLENNSKDRMQEMIFNALRRADEGKYDDAIARLYRAIEMLGQIEFEKSFNCLTSDVQLFSIPENLRDDINNKYYDNKDGKIKLPLFATFDFLKKIDNEVGVRFYDKFNLIKKILHLRNNSILAHGNNPLGADEFNEAFELIEFLIDLHKKNNDRIYFLELQ